MKRPLKLRRHKKNGYAFVYVGTKQVYLGRWGSSEAQAAYDRFLLKWAKSNQETEHPRQTDDYLLAEVVCAFLEDYVTCISKSGLTLTYRKDFTFPS